MRDYKKLRKDIVDKIIEGAGIITIIVISLSSYKYAYHSLHNYLKPSQQVQQKIVQQYQKCEYKLNKKNKECFQDAIDSNLLNSKHLPEASIAFMYPSLTHNCEGLIRKIDENCKRRKDFKINTYILEELLK